MLLTQQTRDNMRCNTLLDSKSGPLQKSDFGSPTGHSTDTYSNELIGGHPQHLEHFTITDVTNGLPPGFEDFIVPSDTILEVEEFIIPKQARRSPRLGAKNKGNYVTAIDKAAKLKDSLNFSARKPNKERRLKPLTPCQAELVVATACITVDEELEAKVRQLASNGSVAPYADNV